MAYQQERSAFQQSTGGRAPTRFAGLHSVQKSQQSFEEMPSEQDPSEGKNVSISLRTNPVFKRGEHSANPHFRSDTSEVSDWLAHQLRGQSAKAISEKTGQGQRAAEAVKMGRNGLTMAHLVNICRADPDFRAQFFAFCGGKLEGDPSLVADLSRAINAVMQQQGRASE